MNLCRVYVDGKWRVAEVPREIRRGRHKGRIEVTIQTPVCVGGAWEMRLRKRIVSPHAVHIINTGGEKDAHRK